MIKWLATLIVICVLLTGCSANLNIPSPKTKSPPVESHPCPDAPLSNSSALSPSSVLMQPPASSTNAKQINEPPKNNNPIQNQTNATQNQTNTIHNQTNKKQKVTSTPVHKSKYKKLSLPELRSKYPGSIILQGSTHERKVALTFDDGPDTKFTPQILDILKQYHVKATFFLVGFRAESHPEIVRRILNEGHTIGNHSYNHANPAKLSARQFEDQISKTQITLQNITGITPKLLRTPYGDINEEQLRWALAHHYAIINWDVDSLDWRQLNTAQVTHNILSHIHKGAIILQHSAGGDQQDLSGTVKALPIIIQKLRSENYEMVSVSQLLHLENTK